MTRSLNITPKITEQHLIVRSGKSEAEVTVIPYITNNKTLHSMYRTGTAEANYRKTRSIAQPVFDIRSTFYRLRGDVERCVLCSAEVATDPEDHDGV